MSVGLGNVWRFPFVAYENGGGAFLIPYLIVLAFIGRSLYFLEMFLGQFSSSGAVKLWDCVPIAKGNLISINFDHFVQINNLINRKVSDMVKRLQCGVSLPITVP